MNDNSPNGRLKDRETLERYSAQASALEADLWRLIREGNYDIPAIVLLGASIAARTTSLINLIKDPTYRIELHTLYSTTFWEIHNNALLNLPKLLAQEKLTKLLNDAGIRAGTPDL